MDRPAVARSREIASLLVIGALVASTLSPAVILSAGPEPRVTTADASARPAAADSNVAVAAAHLPAGPISSTPPTTVPRKAVDRPHPVVTDEDTSGCDPAPATLKPAKVVSHGSRDQKVVALTFDDGWDPGNTMKILGILQHLHVNATFFPVGRAVQLFPSVWRAVADGGFPIADHSYDHPHLKGMCFAAQLTELTRPQAIIRSVLGIEPFAVMRPPYGSWDANTKLAARAAGDSRVVLWDIDTRDWSGSGQWRIYRAAMAGQGGSIVLMHTFVKASAFALPAIIAGYRARGFTFVTIGQMLGLGGPVPYP